MNVSGKSKTSGWSVAASQSYFSNSRRSTSVTAEKGGGFRRRSQRVGPAARAVLLLARHLVRRAHGPVTLLATLADARTELGRPDEAAVGREVERGRHLRRDVRRAVAQAGSQRRRVHDLAG